MGKRPNHEEQKGNCSLVYEYGQRDACKLYFKVEKKGNAAHIKLKFKISQSVGRVT